MNLKEVELALEKNRIDYDLEVKRHNDFVNNYVRTANELSRQKSILLNDYNLDKVLLAEAYIRTLGVKKYYGNGETISCLNECILDVANGFKQLKDTAFGCKNYDRWVCQRCDCPYGYGPSHGYVVFEISLQDLKEDTLKNISDDTVNVILWYLNNLKNENFRNTVLTDK